MKFPISYKCLTQNEFSKEEFNIVPLRFEDRFAIMKWRNEQIYHLRQAELLNRESQENYFKNTVASLFEQKKPNQILFSYLKNNKCVGYGGLVHINWIDKNAEISFIMKTELEKQDFKYHWSNFLSMIENVAFKELNFHKLYVFAFDIRSYLYPMLESNKYFLDALLKDHCFVNDQFKDVVIYSKIYSK